MEPNQIKPNRIDSHYNIQGVLEKLVTFCNLIMGPILIKMILNSNSMYKTPSLVWLFNSISTFVGYLMLKLF